MIHLLLLALLVMPVAAGAAPVSDHEKGRALYNYRCYYCHGYSGDARTLAATYLQPPPRDFTRADPDQLTRERMLKAVRDGVPGTAMKSFSRFLSEDEMALVVDFVRNEFMLRKAANTRYHTAENGWPDHDRYRAAFPFATGEIPLDAPQEDLSLEQRAGLRLFLTSCVSCHDRARVEDEGPVWEPNAISYPRNNFSFTQVDASSGASIYAMHDQKPEIPGLTELEREGERLFQDNCAFCHARDGTGKNWIGSFLERKPRNLTDEEFMAQMTPGRLKRAIADGLEGTSMPAWKAVLSEQQIDAIVAYISRAFHPVGGHGEK